jgi:SAM-dependent methyltransferase
MARLWRAGPAWASSSSSRTIAIVADARRAFSLMYRLGFKPWERDATPAQLAEMAAGRQPGRALELGCGTGRQAVELAQRGWEVTAVDYVPKAIEEARSRARGAGVEVRFLAGDVTRLEDLQLGAPFDVVYDNKCFHGLSPAARQRYVSGVAGACRPGGIYLLFALAPSRWRALFGLTGVDPREVEERFGERFQVLRQVPGGSGPFEPDYYELVRHQPGG